MKVVIDTNVLLVIIPSTSKYHFVYQLLKAKYFSIALSAEILLEYEEQLTYRYQLDSVDKELQSFLELENIELITVDYFWNFITADADDNKFGDCAVSSNADFIITNDKHFDILQTISFPRINTLTLQQFIELLRETVNLKIL